MWRVCALRRRCFFRRCAWRSWCRPRPTPPPAGSGSAGRTHRRPFSSQSGRDAPNARETPRGSAPGQPGRCMAYPHHRPDRDEMIQDDILTNWPKLNWLWFMMTVKENVSLPAPYSYCTSLWLRPRQSGCWLLPSPEKQEKTMRFKLALLTTGGENKNVVLFLIRCLSFEQ